MATDPTPIQDPRNAVGLLTDVLDLAFSSTDYQLFAAPAIVAGVDLACVPAARDLGRMFAKGPRKVLNGYRRRNTAELYQQLKQVHDDVPADQWRTRDAQRRDHMNAAWGMAKRVVRCACDVMEDARRWEKFVKGWTEQRYGTTTFHAPEWPKLWADHQRDARTFGIDTTAIAKLECNWRFRDVTERSHRGLNTRAAFEAAWLAGQYEFAHRLVTESFK